MPQQDGLTKRQHLQTIERQTGIPPDELIVPEIPLGGKFLHDVFYSIKGSADEWTASLSLTNFKVWMEFYDVDLSIAEIDAIKILDRVLINTYTTEKKDNNG